MNKRNEGAEKLELLERHQFCKNLSGKQYILSLALGLDYEIVYKSF